VSNNAGNFRDVALSVVQTVTLICLPILPDVASHHRLQNYHKDFINYSRKKIAKLRYTVNRQVKKTARRRGLMGDKGINLSAIGFDPRINF
jgi:hypothetical protein